MEQLRPGSMPQCASRRIVDHRLEMRCLSPFVQSGFLGSFPFDPVGLDSPANAEKEIKNGRLGAPRCWNVPHGEHDRANALLPGGRSWETMPNLL